MKDVGISDYVYNVTGFGMLPKNYRNMK